MPVVEYSFPTRIFSGSGSIGRLPEVLNIQQAKNIFLITDRGMVDLPVVQELKKLLETSGFRTVLFADFEGNPVESHVTAGVAAFHKAGADTVIAIGGGATIDVAKAVALMAHHPGDLFDYEDGKPDGRVVDQEMPLLIAVPTTAGTGSEVGRSSVISDDTTRAKKIIFSERLMPYCAFLDPDLTLGLPAKITAATGMDALTHLIEAYLATGFHPMCDGIALEGLRMVSASLRTCVRTGSDIVAREMMLTASMMGAVAFQKGLGLNHSFAHALSTVCDLHHGLANGIMLPYCMSFNIQASKSKFETMATIVTGEKAGAGELLSWIVELKKDIGVPTFLSEVGVGAGHLDRLIEVAANDSCHPLGPSEVKKEDFKTIFTRALGSE